MAKIKKPAASVCEKLKALHLKKIFPHSILLSGGNQNDRINTALYIASMLECTDSGDSPCSECNGCIKVFDGVHPDVYIVQSGGKSDTVKLEEIKKIKEDSNILPNEGNAKIYIFPDGAKIRADGQNSLLKIMEEPPDYVYIIICCEVRSTLLPTVLSRVYDITVGNSSYLLSIGKKSAEVCGKLANALVRRNEYELMNALNMYSKDRNALSACLDNFLFILRDAIMSGESISGMADEVMLLKNGLSMSEMIKICDIIKDIQAAAERNANMNLLISVASSKMFGCISGQPN